MSQEKRANDATCSTSQSQRDQEHALMIDEMFRGYNEEELNEAMQAERDVLGGGQSQPQFLDQLHLTSSFDASIMETALTGFHEALNVLPTEQKQAYLLAKARNPQVLQVEASPQQFLKACHYNYWKAAESYALYWKKRLETFGEQCFHKALTITDPKVSALSAPDIEGLESGANVLLPQTDEFGRIVLLADRDQMNHCVQDPNIRLRMCFYVLNVLLEHDQAVQNGFVWIFAFEDKSDPAKTENKAWNSTKEDDQTSSTGTDDSIPAIDTTNNDLACTSGTREVEADQEETGVPSGGVGGGALKLLLSQVIPIQLKALHVVVKRSPTLIERLVHLWLLFFQSFTFLKMRMRMHFVTNKEMLLENLKPFGLSKLHLPQRMGGTATTVQQTWFAERVKVERKRYAFLWKSSEKNDFHHQNTRSIGKESATNFYQPLSAPTNRTDNELVLKRKLMQVMSREKSQDREIAYLTSLVESLSLRRSRLNREHDFLESLTYCSHFVLVIYERDVFLIKQILQRVAMISCNCESLMQSLVSEQQIATLSQTASEFVFQHYLVFGGRSTGATAASNLTRNRDKDYAIAFERALQPILASFWSDNWTSSLDISTIHADDEVSDGTLVKRLQMISLVLKDRKSFLQRQGVFLQHLKTCAQFLADQTDYDMTKIRSFMEEFFVKFCPENTDTVAPELLANPDLPKIMTGYFLQNLVHFQGRHVDGHWMIQKSDAAPSILGLDQLMKDFQVLQSEVTQSEQDSLNKLNAQVEIIRNSMQQDDRAESSVEAGIEPNCKVGQSSTFSHVENTVGPSEESSVQAEVELLVSTNTLDATLVGPMTSLLNDRSVFGGFNTANGSFAFYPPADHNSVGKTQDEKTSTNKNTSRAGPDDSETSLWQRRLKNRQRAIKAKKRRRL